MGQEYVMGKKKGGLKPKISSTYQDVVKKSKSSDIVKKLAKMRGEKVLKGKSKKVSMRDV